MDNSDHFHYNHFFYKFHSLDKELETKVKCLLQGCQRIAKYSISLIKPNSSTADKQEKTKFICSNHLANWESIKINLIDEKNLKE